MSGKKAITGDGRFIWHVLALLVVAIWGVTFISTKVLIGAGLTPSQIFAIRFTMAYAGIWILCAARKGSATSLWAGTVRDELIFVFLGVTGGSLYFLTENTALALTQACNVSFIVCSAPLLTALMTLAAKKFLKGPLVDGLEDVKVSWKLVLGTILCVAGMAVVVFEGASLHLSPKGDLMAVAAALCWALYSVLMGQMTQKYGALFATRKVFFWGLATIAPLFVADLPSADALLKPAVVLNLLFLGLVASLGCFAVWNKVMSRLGNVTSTNYVYLNPFFTLLGATLFLGEKMTLPSALGSAAIILGVFVAGRPSK